MRPLGLCVLTTLFPCGMPELKWKTEGINHALEKVFGRFTYFLLNNNRRFFSINKQFPSNS